MFRFPANEAEPTPSNPSNDDLREKTADWLNQHPRVAALFLRFAKELASRGRHFGIGLLAERVRWEHAFEYGEDFKVNNNYRAYIARWLIQEDPSLERFLKFRKTRW